MRYYYSGLPRSDELYHHGTIGMQWGRRLWQNEDGSLTPAGRLRYGVGVGARTIGKGLAIGAKAVGKAVITPPKKAGEAIARGAKARLAKKAPSMLSDEDLKKYTERLKLEAAYQQTLADVKDARRKKHANDFLRNLAKESAKTIANKAASNFADKVFAFEKEDEKQRKLLNVAELANLTNAKTEITKSAGVVDAYRKQMRDVQKEKDKVTFERAKQEDKLTELTPGTHAYKNATKKIKDLERKETEYSFKISDLNSRAEDAEKAVRLRKEFVALLETKQNNQGGGGGGGGGGNRH